VEPVERGDLGERELGEIVQRGVRLVGLRADPAHPQVAVREAKATLRVEALHGEDAVHPDDGLGAQPREERVTPREPHLTADPAHDEEAHEPERASVGDDRAGGDELAVAVGPDEPVRVGVPEGLRVRVPGSSPRPPPSRRRRRALAGESAEHGHDRKVDATQRTSASSRARRRRARPRPRGAQRARLTWSPLRATPR
jgi:hypothetical protein